MYNSAAVQESDTDGDVFDFVEPAYVKALSLAMHLKGLQTIEVGSIVQVSEAYRRIMTISIIRHDVLD